MPIYNEEEAQELIHLGINMVDVSCLSDEEPVFAKGIHAPICIIVGNGPSAKGFTPPDGVPVIAVNGAIDWINRSEHQLLDDYFFTLDPSKENMRRMQVQNQRYGFKYVAAVPDEIELPDGVIRYKRIARRNEEPKPRFSPEWYLWRWSCVSGLSEVDGEINTGNSAYGALGLAYLLGFKHVSLIGVDGTDEPRLDGKRSGNLDHLGLLFESALPQIDVVSCGVLDTVPQMSMQEWLCKYSPY